MKGEDGGRILISLAGELLDVSAGREMYGPGGGYSALWHGSGSRMDEYRGLNVKLIW